MSTEIDNTVVQPTEAANRIYNLTLELHQAEQNKKSASRSFSDEIKRIKGEIKDILKGAGEDVNE